MRGADKQTSKDTHDASVSTAPSTLSDEYVAALYDELRTLASKYLSRRPGVQTLQPTALVHEAFLKIKDRSTGSGSWVDQSHFFAAAARAMRHILVDASRRKRSVKHGGDAKRVFVDPRDLVGDDPAFSFNKQTAVAVCDLEAALVRLEHCDSQTAAVVELRFFGGLTEGQIALLLGVSERTVERRWRTGRAFLFSELQTAPADEATRSN